VYEFAETLQKKSAFTVPLQSWLRRASITLYGIAATGSYIELDSLRDAPPGGEALSPFLGEARKPPPEAPSLWAAKGLLGQRPSQI